MNVSKDARDYSRGMLQLVAGAVIISFSPVFVKLAHVGPNVAGFYRTIFGGVVLVLFALARRQPLYRGWKPLALAIVCAVLFAADLAFWHRAILTLGPGLSTILGNFQVFFLAAFGILVFREAPDWKYLVSMPVAIAGLFLLVGIDWAALDSGYKLGVLFGLATAVTYAAYTLVLQAAGSRPIHLSATANLAVISIGTAVILGGLALLEGGDFRIPDSQTWTALLAYGILCQALGWVIICLGLAKVPASRAGLILVLQPMLAFLWDVIFFSRPTDAIDVTGALLVAVAIYMGSSHRPKRPS